MPTYKVSWKAQISCWDTVDADSEEEAIEKAKRGEYNDDCDTDPDRDVPNSYKCNGIHH